MENLKNDKRVAIINKGLLNLKETIRNPSNHDNSEAIERIMTTNFPWATRSIFFLALD